MNKPDQPHLSACCHSPPAASVDPVCGMTVEAGSPHRAEHAGQHFGFCSAGCRANFLKQPTRYLAGTSEALGRHATNGHQPTEPAKTPAPPEVGASAGTIYTCPMHPEVRQIGPGHCPKCGMALEPLMPTETTDDSEIRAVQRRFWIALTLAIPVILIAMAPHLFGSAVEPATAWTLRMLELTLSAPVVLWAAVPYYRRGGSAWLIVRPTCTR